MIDLPTLQSIRVNPQPKVQKFMAHCLLGPNYGFLPGVKMEVDESTGYTLHDLPPAPVIFAMNHTDKYNYWPFQYTLYKHTGRLTATWVKGKYYQNKWMGRFMRWANNIPAISKGYLLTQDFRAVAGRAPSEEEYRVLRGALDAETSLGDEDRGKLPDALWTRPRNILGHDFDPQKESYINALCTLNRDMMEAFANINGQAFADGVDLLIFPQGTRSIRLSKGHIGLSQVALRHKVTVVPVGCNGSDKVYPGASPWASKGKIVYRIGKPITYADVPECHINEAYTPFTGDAEEKFQEKFRTHTDMIMERINGLLDEEYQFSDEKHSDGVSGHNRFV